MKRFLPVIGGFAVVLIGLLICTATIYASSPPPRPFYEDGRMGLEDADGNVILPPTFDEISFFTTTRGGDNHTPSIDVDSNFAPVRNGSSWGFIDRRGNIIVPLVYDRVDRFINGFAAVSRNNMWGFVDTAGREIVAPTYSQVRFFTDGMAAVRQGNYWGFIDTSGREIVPPTFNDAGHFHEGHAAVGIREEGTWTTLWGYINRTGTVVIPAEFSAARWFSGGLAAVAMSVDGATRWGFIDLQGNTVIPPIYRNVEPFEDGFSVVRMPMADDSRFDKFGVINRSGHVVVPAIYTDVQIQDRGFVVAVGEDLWSWDFRWGVLDLQGNVVLPTVHTSSTMRVVRQMMNLPADAVAALPTNVEMLEWSAVRGILPLRTPFQIMDIGTGIRFNMSSLSNGNHADVETVTAQDTALMMEAFGGWQTWSSRPVWVTVGNRTFSAALHSMPHDVATIPDNNMDGHVCLHFYGSTTHNTNLPVHLDTVLAAQAAYDVLSHPGFRAFLAGGAAPPAQGSTQVPGETQAPAATPTPAVNPSSWAAPFVATAIDHGLVPAALQTRYTQAITRGEFSALAVALYETVTGQEIEGRMYFSDTNDINVQKMGYLGVVSGVGGDRFAPNNPITREQAAVMIARLAEVIGQPLPQAFPTFADNARISSWAIVGVGQMQASGIMGGVGNNQFSPRGDYTREQSIVSLLRLFELLVE